MLNDIYFTLLKINAEYIYLIVEFLKYFSLLFDCGILPKLKV